MKKSILSPADIIKAKILVNEDSAKVWAMILYVIALGLIVIWNTQAYESKVFKVAKLSHEVKMLRAEFVDTRSELMELKMESTITKTLQEQGIVPSEVPPVKIHVNKKEDKTGYWNKLWP